MNRDVKVEGGMMRWKMKTLSMLLAAMLFVPALQAAPKKLLVVTTTTGYRHASIPDLEKMLAQLGKQSSAFSVDFVQQPPGKQGTEAWDAALKKALLQLAPTNLKNYDGVVFASTTGNLPIPDPQGFLDWIKEGHAFIGIHAASDTFHHWPGYIAMLGGEFEHHGPQLGVDCIVADPSNPATARLGKTWRIQQEEIYQFKNFDPAKVHELLYLDKKPQKPFTPGHYPVSWCKHYGAGRVFYTSLGHRADLISDDPNLKNRINPVAMSEEYRQHVLGGIEWALGIRQN